MSKIQVTKELIVRLSAKNRFQLSFHQMKYLGLNNKKGFRDRILGVELESEQVEFLFRLKYMSKRKLKQVEIIPIDLPYPSILFKDKPKSRNKRISNKKAKIQKRKEYNEYLNSEKWKEKRQVVLLRDDFKCTECGSTHELHIHHLTYEHFKLEDISELITLCSLCHRKVHGK